MVGTGEGTQSWGPEECGRTGLLPPQGLRLSALWLVLPRPLEDGTSALQQP